MQHKSENWAYQYGKTKKNLLPKNSKDNNIEFLAIFTGIRRFLGKEKSFSWRRRSHRMLHVTAKVWSLLLAKFNLLLVLVRDFASFFARLKWHLNFVGELKTEFWHNFYIFI